MLKKIKEKLISFKNWTKRQWKKIVVLIIGGSVVLAAGLPKDDISKAKLIQKYNASNEIKAEYQMKGASLVKHEIKNAELDKYKGEPKDKIKITIGDENLDEFVPNIELKRWNEVSFKIKPKLEGVAKKDKTLKLEGKKIKFGTPKIDYEFYDYEEGYKFIWTLKEKPATNTICFDIESDGLDFYYQPALNEEYPESLNCSPTECDTDSDGELDSFRPENVIGSYAVYHSTKGGMNDTYGKEYKIGKFGHIFTPRLYDSNGWELFAERLLIKNGQYCVVIPENFWNTAVYPIKSNDTFGYTGAGETQGYDINGWLLAGKGILSEDGDITKVTALLQCNATRNAKVALFTLSGTTLTLYGSGSDPASIPTAKALRDIPFSQSAIAGTYYIGICADGTCWTFYDSGSAGDTKQKNNTYPEFPEASYSTVGDQARLTVIYCTYTPGNGAARTRTKK